MANKAWWMQLGYEVWVISGYVFLFWMASRVIRLLRWLDTRRRASRHSRDR
jgi:uncharacterized membrane protein